MFADTHLIDITRLSTLGHPSPYIYLAIAFLWLLPRTPAAFLFHDHANLLTSNKPLPPSGNPHFNLRFLLGIVTGTFVLLHSNAANTLYLSLTLLHSTLSHRPL